MCISANCWSPWLDFFLGKILRIGGVLHISQLKSFSCCQNILDATTAGCTHIAMYSTWNFSACKSPPTQPKMTLLANLVSALYINPLSCPAVHMCTTQMNSFFCAILLALGRRANFVCAAAFPRWIMREQNFPDCPQCIHDLWGWEEFNVWGAGCVESCLRVVAQTIRPLFRLYSPPLPPFPPHIRAGGLLYSSLA